MGGWNRETLRMYNESKQNKKILDENPDIETPSADPNYTGQVNYQPQTPRIGMGDLKTIESNMPSYTAPTVKSRSFFGELKSNLDDLAKSVGGFQNKKINELTNSKLGAAEIGAINSAGLGLGKQVSKLISPGVPTAYQQAEENHPVAYKIGELGGYIAPGGLAEKTIGKPLENFIASKTANKLLPGLVNSATSFGAMSGVESAINGDSGKDIAKNSAIGAATGLGFNLAGKAVGKGLSMLKKPGELPVVKSDLKPVQEVKPIDSTNMLKTKNEPVVVKNTSMETPIDNTNVNVPKIEENINTIETSKLNNIYDKPISQHTEADINNFKTVDEVNKYIETLKKESEKTSDLQFKGLIMNLQLFAEKKAKQLKSRFVTNTLKNSPMLEGEDVQKTIDSISGMYDIKPNEQSVERARQEIIANPQSVIDRISNSESLNSAEDAAAAGLITNQLRQEAKKSGDYSKLKHWLETVQPKVTSTAQSLQAISTWKKLTPEGALMKAQQVVAKVNRDGEKEFGKNFEKVELTPDDMKFIDETMTKVENMPEGREKDLEFSKVKKHIAEKVPPKLADKVAALQRIQLLLNPKTMIRNVLGNVIMGGLENIKDIPGSAIDALASLKTGERTTLAPSLKGLATQGKGLVKGAKETIQDAKLGVNTSPSSGQFDLPETTAFRKGPLAKIEKATNVGLELGDRPFYQAAYDEALRQQMKINKVDVPTEEMINKAKAVAEDRTFQNVSEMVEGFKRLQGGLNRVGSAFGMGSKDFGVGNIALPFTKTPANILDKALDYSPVGSIKAIAQLISKKEFNQKQFVDRVGRSLTGSAIIWLGYNLAEKGLLTGSANKDKDVASLEKQTGKSPYAFKMGDTYRTFDWAQPAAIPLAIGADIFHQGKNQKQATNVIMDAIKSGGTTLFQQSLLQGMQKLFGGTDPVSGFANTLSGIPTQFLPGSLSTAITKLSDPYVRDTYDPSKVKTIENQIQSKIPGLSSKLPQKLDSMGRPMLQYNGNNNAFNVFVNPGTTTTYNPAPAEKLAMDIFNASGDKTQFPRVADNKITYTDAKTNKQQTIQLTPQEKQSLQQYIGQKTNDMYSQYANNSKFTSQKPEDQARVLQGILSQIYNDGKYQILKGRGIVGK